MADSPLDPFSLEGSLARATARLDDLRLGWAARARLDLAGAPGSTLPFLLSKLDRDPSSPLLYITPDGVTAERTARNLRFFLGPDSNILLYPNSDVSPYAEVAPDRRASMDRLSVLFHLAHGLPTAAVVVPAPALLRRIPPREAILNRSLLVKTEEELDREALVDVLVRGGYVRVPVVEDPGTFAVRGALVDIYTPHSTTPFRIELDDWLVLSITAFDPDTQRSLGEKSQFFVHPAREIPQDKETLASAKVRVRTLIDQVDYPSTKARTLLADIETGRNFYGVDAYLPAFFDELHTLFDYLPKACHVVVEDPPRASIEMGQEHDQAAGDFQARAEEGTPTFPLSALYLSAGEIQEQLDGHPLAANHQIIVAGGGEEDAFLGPLLSADRNEQTAETPVLDFGGDDHERVVAVLKNRRRDRATDVLLPLQHRLTQWQQSALRIFVTARTESQATRLIRLLKNDDLLIAKHPRPWVASAKPKRQLELEVVVGGLADGFTLASEGVVFLTEEEIFGSRSHRTRTRRSKRATHEAFLEDLRELKVGDYVVHIDHGIGKYLGIEQKSLGQSQYERARGLSAKTVEVLVVEYKAGDRLFLPVTRLNQIQKLSGKEGQTPRIDKLGGQTFLKTKSKVKKKVRQMAEELLKLYAERAAVERPPLPPAGAQLEEFEATFPFDETPDQSRAITDVMNDLEKPRPMDRVICGDVGFGKTEVALRATFRVAMGEKQVALLCPTTVLAQQHFNNFRQRFAQYPLNVAVMSRFVDKATQTKTIAGLKSGSVDVVIGTHRILSKDVHFKDLGLLVVDEEQRFGVTHKERIKKLRREVDVLTLSATPIPRTLQMAVGGLRGLSLITTAPTDRRAVRTFATRWNDHLLTEAIRREMSRGGQVFFVYNRIEGLYERGNLLAKLVPEARIAVAHGQMNSVTLEKLMVDFVEGRFDVLCSTAIIESGLDIPRANTMIIDRADMFGLSQLYQLRGRVGRSKERAYCYLLTPPPQRMTDEARFRIQALERFTELGSGFHVASLDMEQRGAGAILGGEQSGNVAQVGMDLFLSMLEEAVAELRGEPIMRGVDPEITFDIDWFIPDDYIEEVGVRLSFYKRFAKAPDAATVADLGGEMEERFGPLPGPARLFVRAMALKPELRDLSVLGCEGNPTRVTLHLREDTPLDPAKVMQRVTMPNSGYKLTPDLRLTRRFEESKDDAIAKVEKTLSELRLMLRDPG